MLISDATSLPRRPVPSVVLICPRVPPVVLKW